MNLRCGLLDGGPVWRELLRSEGVPSCCVALDSIEDGAVSVVVVDRPLKPGEAAALRAYLRRGGALVAAAAFVADALGMAARRRHIRYLVDDREERPWFDLLDIDGACCLPAECSRLRTEENSHAMFLDAWGGGLAAVLPFDPADLVTPGSGCYRSFPAGYDRLPFERVASRSRAALLQMLHGVLEELHHRRNLPYVRISQFPADIPSVFAFRLDTDRASDRQIEQWRELSAAFGAPFTWFVDTGHREGKLEAFAKMQNQEIGVHCYRHRLFQTAAAYSEDIGCALNLLRAVGIDPAGYAAPFGHWSEQMGRAIDGIGMAYSSEFLTGFDGVPFFPTVRATTFQTLQVPVHPVSCGALRRSGYSHARMVEYFVGVIDRKIARHEPVFLYDHPIHDCVDVGWEILKRVRALPGMTLGEYATWWKERIMHLETLTVEFRDGMLWCRDDRPSNGIRLAISTVAGEANAAVDSAIDLARVSLRPPVPFRGLEDVRRSRDFDVRTWIGTTVVSLFRRKTV